MLKLTSQLRLIKSGSWVGLGHAFVEKTAGEAADRIELLEGALANAHKVFAAEVEGLQRIIYKARA